MCVCVCVYVRVYMYVYMYIYIYTYIYIYIFGVTLSIQHFCAPAEEGDDFGILLISGRARKRQNLASGPFLSRPLPSEEGVT